ncbi:phage integrase family protein [Desulforamulus reducens MI-1]|uniref:Phage integrase family protein n=1 Tax=Desulforamulus reducens (strain ATCC BAA-1160 / DSM 100696 / MI-1) TaxID=349161 RepID=A4J1G5_DESRM|nr:tyrosine-type recombinase/integrase [Desulforamulus reducens]ABO48918.1 phage integrase family protein [Desulforamulus reducens MI-1]
MTNQELVKTFLMYQETKNLSKRTIEWYQFTLNKLIDYCKENNISIESMTTPQARQYVFSLQKSISRTGKKYADNGINGYIRSVKIMFNYLFEDEYIEKNPFAKVKQIKTDKVIIETFEVEEVKRMLNQFNKKVYTEFRDALLIQILYDTGIRISEAINLKISDIDTDKNMFKVFGKGHKERMVPFGRSIKREILKYLPKRNKEVDKELDEGYLFSTRNGTALTIRNVHRKIVEVGTKAKIKGKRLSAHTFRHTFAKTYLVNGGNLFSLQTIMGHNDLSTTRKYVHLLTEDIQKQHRQFSPLDNL